MSIAGEIAASLEEFHVNEANLHELINGPEGEIVRDLVSRAIRVEGLAKQNATSRPGPMVRTGRLRGSITWRLGVDLLGPYADIGSNVEYAIYLELGTSNMPAYPFLLPALETGGG